MLKILETKVHLQPIHYLRLTDSLGIHIIVHVYRHCTIHQAVSSGATLLLVWSPGICWTQGRVVVVVGHMH